MYLLKIKTLFAKKQTLNDATLTDCKDLEIRQRHDRVLVVVLDLLSGIFEAAFNADGESNDFFGNFVGC